MRDEKQRTVVDLSVRADRYGDRDLVEQLLTGGRDHHTVNASEYGVAQLVMMKDRR